MDVMKVDLANLPDDLRAAAVDVAQRVRAAGGRALMVGGSVRDLLCGRHVKDVDIEVFGVAPDDLKRVLGERIRGSRDSRTGSGRNACGRI